MSDQGSVSCRGVLGAGEVLRSRILEYFCSSRPRAVLLSAPSGYGKTVLAAQLVSHSRFTDCAWVSLAGREMTGECLLAEVLQALRERNRRDINSSEEAEMPAVPDAMAALADQIAGAEGPLCLVLDDLPLSLVAAEVSELAALFIRSSSDHALLLTTREVWQGPAPSFHRFLTIDADDLRFDQAEVNELLSGFSEACSLGDHSQAVLDVSRGQAVLVSVLARHIAMRGSDFEDGRGSLDLTALLVGLAETQLDSVEIEVLATMALLGKATPAELAAVNPLHRHVDFERLSRKIPLLRLTFDTAGRITALEMHDLAQGVYGSGRFLSSVALWELSSAESPVARVLERRRDYCRLIPLLVDHLSAEELVDWALAHGEQLISRGYGSELGRVLELLSPGQLLSHPRLLLMSAEYGPAASDASERMARAATARELAECEGDKTVIADALLAMASAAKDLGKIRESHHMLEEVMALPDGAVTNERRLQTAAHLVTQRALFLELQGEGQLEALLEQAVDSSNLREPVLARIVAQLAAAAYGIGNTRAAMDMFSRVVRFEEVPLVLRAMALGNLALTLVEMGQLGRAQEVLDQHTTVSGGYGLEVYRAAAEGVHADLAFVVGSQQAALDRVSQSIRGYQATGDKLTEAHARIGRATHQRTLGDFNAAMADVEAALEFAANNGIAYHQYLAEAELAANFLALGDLDAAARHAQRVRQACTPGNALHQILRADMVLAEVGRRQGRIEESVDRLLAHEEYVLEDNMNYIIAMYIRSFPALLGLFASALGAQRLPGYMLRMISGTHAEDALLASRDLVSADEWKTLASRLLGEDGPERLELLATVPTCCVRMFGGLEVTIGDREIPEADWRKRKSRLLFAMLVLQHGRDLSRESIYEYLWPEMTEAKARNNLYVTWSAMKAALMPDAERNTPCPYVNHKGGVCRISTALVSSDVARFDELFAEARSAESAGKDAEALRAYESLVDVYRGELLPGDIYDDWFASTRDRYRQDFGDSMLAAHRLLCEQGDHASALRMVRRGIAVDSWREDLCQAALKSQIVLGQRGAAVETYMACRSCLAEDLGLDPSNETVRLYEQVLAMEDGPESAFTA